MGTTDGNTTNFGATDIELAVENISKAGVENLGLNENVVKDMKSIQSFEVEAPSKLINNDALKEKEYNVDLFSVSSPQEESRGDNQGIFIIS